MPFTAAEHYFIELINRARLDPLAEARRHDLDLNAGLAKGTIGTGSLQVLAPSTVLGAAADGHSDWMLAADDFAHTGQGGSNARTRMEDEGYVFEGLWSWRENLAWRGISVGQIDLNDAIEAHNEGLYRSASHRTNTFTPQIREIGVGQVKGEFTFERTDYQSSMVTLNFAATGTSVFVTGVAFDDVDDNLFYGIGEGLDTVTVMADGVAARTTAAGGYGIGVTASHQTDLRVLVDGDTLARLTLDTSDGNVKLDVVTQGDGDRVLLTSGSGKVTLSHVDEVRLLGRGDLDFTGSARSDTLIGNHGDNRLQGNDGRDMLRGRAGEDVLSGGPGRDLMSGNRGHDRLEGQGGDDLIHGGRGRDALYGGAGDDWLVGGGGRDRLQGGAGDDVLMGGRGRDSFVFDEGRDRVVDFQIDIDRLLLNAGLADSVEDALDHATVRNGNVVFDFGGGDRLIVDGLTDVTVLADDISFL